MKLSLKNWNNLRKYGLVYQTKSVSFDAMQIIKNKSESIYPSTIFCSSKDCWDKIGHALRSSPLRWHLGNSSDPILLFSFGLNFEKGSSIFLKPLHSSSACPAAHCWPSPPWCTLFRYTTRYDNFGKVWLQSNNCVLVCYCIVKLHSQMQSWFGPRL